jgi:hypothetical protein
VDRPAADPVDVVTVDAVSASDIERRFTASSARSFGREIWRSPGTSADVVVLTAPADESLDHTVGLTGP